MARAGRGLSVLTALFLGMVPLVAIAQELSDPFEAMYNPKKLLRGAKLTEAQLAQIRELRKATRPQERAIEAQMQTLNAKFADLFTSEGPIDGGALIALSEQLDRLDLQLDQLKVPNMLKIRALLTPEQLHRVSQTHQTIKSLEEQKRLIESQRKALDPTVAGEEGP
jgi:Spy/CpxP family protein refolding chaperone